MQGHSSTTQARHGARNAANTCQYFTQLLKPEMSILDVGCGPGSISSSLAALVPLGSVMGIDSSEITLGNARKQANLPENCTFQTGDALNLAFPDNTFDVVHTSQVLCHIADTIGVLKEFRRVLRPGGFIACREGDSVSLVYYPTNPGLDEWARVTKALQISKGANPETGRRLLSLAAEAGFDTQRCTYSGGSITQAGKDGATFGLSMSKQRAEDEVYRKNIFDIGATDEKGLELMGQGWEIWARHPHCVFSMYCGQIVAYK